MTDVHDRLEPIASRTHVEPRRAPMWLLTPEGNASAMEPTDSETSTEVTTNSATDESSSPNSKRRRGTRGGQRRRGSGPSTGAVDHDDAMASGDDDRNDVELPEPMSEGRPSAEAAEKALVRRPKIGDTMPIPTKPPPGPATVAKSGGQGGGASDARQGRHGCAGRAAQWHPQVVRAGGPSRRAQHL